MAGANHEAGITVKVSTDGTEKLDAVARGMDELAQGAAEAAPKLKPIAEGVQQIGREAGIAEQARTLGALGDEARGAATGVDALGKEARQAAAGVDGERMRCSGTVQQRRTASAGTQATRLAHAVQSFLPQQQQPRSCNRLDAAGCSPHSASVCR